MFKTREEIYIARQIRNEIPTVKKAGRNYIFREFEIEKLVKFIYKIYRRGLDKGRENAKINLKAELKKDLKKYID